MKARSTKTSAAGIIGAIGLILVGWARLVGGLEPDPDAPGGSGLVDAVTPEEVGYALTALAALLGGLAARDDNVTSEGTRAPKAQPGGPDEPQAG